MLRDDQRQSICCGNGLVRLVVLIAVGFFVAGCFGPKEKGSGSDVGSKATLEDAGKPKALVVVSISPEARVKATAQDVPANLVQGEWRDFLVEIENTAGITAPLIIESEQQMTSYDDEARDRWFELDLVPDGPLSGDLTEFRTLKIRSRDSGVRTTILNFNAGQGTQDLGFRSDVLITFQIENAVSR
jgi:hypothetical protein